MQTASHLLIFTLESQQYAIRLATVERVLRAVEVTPLPKAPKIVLGIVNVQGCAIPVVDLRRRFELPSRELELSDRFIVTRTARFPVILIVDAVDGVMEYEPGVMTSAKRALPKGVAVEGVACLSDGMIFLHNLDSFLSLEEERTLARALPGM